MSQIMSQNWFLTVHHEISMLGGFHKSEGTETPCPHKRIFFYECRLRLFFLRPSPAADVSGTSGSVATG